MVTNMGTYKTEKQIRILKGTLKSSLSHVTVFISHQAIQGTLKDFINIWFVRTLSNINCSSIVSTI